MAAALALLAAGGGAAAAAASPAPAGAAVPPPPLERTVEADLGLRYLTGVTELRGLAGGFELVRRTPRLETILEADADYLATSGRVLRRFAQVSARADLWPRERWSPFGFAIWAKDELAQVESRWQAGAGVKRLLRDTARSKHSVSLALLWEDQVPTRASLRGDEGLFASLRFKDRWQVGDHSSLSSVVFYQPELADPGRFRAFGEVTFDTEVTRSLGLRLEVSGEHDSAPLDPALDRNQLVSVLKLRYRLADPPRERRP